MKTKSRKTVAVILALITCPLLACASVDEDKSPVTSIYKDWSSFIKKGKIENALKLMQEREPHQIYRDLQIDRLKRAHEQSNGGKKVELIGEANISGNIAMVVIREGNSDYDPIYFIKTEEKWLIVCNYSGPVIWVRLGTVSVMDATIPLNTSFPFFRRVSIYPRICKNC